MEGLLMSNETKETTSENVNNDIINVPIKRPIELDGALLSSIKLDFSKMSGADVIQVDEELRREGFNAGFDNIFNHKALLKLASRASGLVPEDLSKLHPADYMEVAFKTRNFFIQW